MTLAIATHEKSFHPWCALCIIQSKWVQPRVLIFPSIFEMLLFFFSFYGFINFMSLGQAQIPCKTGVPQPLLWDCSCLLWGLTVRESRMTIFDPPSSTFPMLELQANIASPGLWSVEDWTSGFVRARWALNQLSHISSPKCIIKMLYGFDLSMICPAHIFLWHHKVYLNKKTYEHRGEIHCKTTVAICFWVTDFHKRHIF